jgi:hypothetical protein
MITANCIYPYYRTAFSSYDTVFGMVTVTEIIKKGILIFGKQPIIIFKQIRDS